MRKQVLLSLLLILVLQAAYAQKMEIEVRVGHGSFAMQDARLLMQRVRYAAPLTPALMEDYPAYVVYSAHFSFPLNDKNHLGFSLGRASTGSRAHHQDYSGELRIDHLLRSVSLTVAGEHRLARLAKEKLDISFYEEIGIIFTEFREESFIQVYSFEESGKEHLSAESFMIEPGLKGRYKLSKWLYVGASLSYLFDTQGKLHLAGNRKAYLAKSQEKPYKIDWSGYRAKLLIGLSF